MALSNDEACQRRHRLTCRLAESFQLVFDCVQSAQVGHNGDTDLTMSQLRALMLLRDGPARMGEVAAAMGVGLPAATGLVDRLESKGLVMRRTSEVDRRVVTCEVTPEGRAHVEQLWHLDPGRLQAMIENLTIIELEEVSDAVGVLAHAAREGAIPTVGVRRLPS